MNFAAPLDSEDTNTFAENNLQHQIPEGPEDENMNEDVGNVNTTLDNVSSPKKLDSATQQN